MSNLQRYFLRLIVKYVVGAKFKRAGTSLPEWRKFDEWSIKNQKVPPGTEIQPVEVNGLAAEWVRAANVRTDNVILYLHGGGFIIGSPATHRELAAYLSAAANIQVLSLDYRLAPEHPFPAAMEDTISAYHWLIEQGCSAKRIVIGGDSAGGGITLQTLLALKDTAVPLPTAAIFLSPVTDMVHFDGDSYSTRANIDPLFTTPAMSKFGTLQYVGDNDTETPLLSPLNMDLSGLPPLCIHVGDQEVLLSDSVRLAERARAAGVEVELKIWPALWHVFQTNTRYISEARQSLDEIGHFVMNRVS